MGRRGRPKNDVIRDKQCNVRITEEALRQLEFACDMTGETKSEVIERGIFMCYNIAKYRE